MTVDKKILDSFLVLSAYNSFAKRYLDSRYVITDTNTIPNTNLFLCKGNINGDCTAFMYLNILKSSLLVYRNSDLVLIRKMNADILVQFLMDNDCQRVLEELYNTYSFAEGMEDYKNFISGCHSPPLTMTSLLVISMITFILL